MIRPFGSEPFGVLNGDPTAFADPNRPTQALLAPQALGQFTLAALRDLFLQQRN